MLRYITVDEDTVVGYDYPKESFYVTNKETTTYRTTSNTELTETQRLSLLEDEILEVLKIVNPSLLDEEGELITKARLHTLATELETLEYLSYTLDDEGEYIKTIQLNSYSSNPIAIDLEKGKIYVMNTNLVYDLSLNEAPIERVRLIQYYYKRHLGLDVSTDDLTILYNLLTDFYKPHAYNTIVTPTSSQPTLTYSSTVEFSNRNSSSTVEYTLLGNPNSEFTYPTNNYISDINSNRVLKLLNEPTGLAVGDKIQITGATTVVDENTSYSADGSYTISAIDTQTSESGDVSYLVKVLESITPYSTVYATGYLKTPIQTVSSISRNNKTFTLTNTVDSSFLVGESVYLIKAIISTKGKEISLNGTYTIYSISDKTITVEETIATDFTGSAQLSGHVSLGNIYSIKDKVITISNQVVGDITGMTVVVNGTKYTVKAYTDNTITVEEDIDDYTPPYAELGIPKASENVKVTVNTSSKETLPTGDFILDTYSETQDYLKLGTTVVPSNDSEPTDYCDFNRMGAKVPTTYTLTGCTVDSMTLTGLYSKVYSSS